MKAPQDVPFQQFDDFAVFVEQALYKLAEFGAFAPEGTLFALEFSKFYFPHFTDRAKVAEAIAAQLIPKSSSGSSFMVWVSLDRYWGTMHPAALAAHLRMSLKTVQWVQNWPSMPARPRCFRGLLGIRCTKLLRLKLEGDDAFEVITRRHPKAHSDIWDRVAMAVADFLEQRGANSRIPTAFLARHLQILYSCYPKEMFELRVRGDEHIPGLSGYTSLWLPRIPPTVLELQDLAARGEYLHPKLLVARCAAAMVMNRSIAFGYPARIFEFDRGESPSR